MNSAKYYNYSLKNTFFTGLLQATPYYCHAIFDHDLMSRNNDPQNFKNRSNS